MDVVAPWQLDSFGDALFFMRSNEQVDVVGHQHVGVDVAAVCGAGLLELFEVELVVGLSTENFGAVVATQYDVLRLAGYDESGQARHDPLTCVDEWTLYGRFTKS